MIDTEQVIDWTARGYFRFPEGDQPLRIDETFRGEWDRFATLLSLLKAGSFGREAEMWAHCRSAKSWQVSGAYAYLIGHSASLKFLQNLHPLMTKTEDIGASMEAAECLAHSGLLSAVPPLLNFVDAYRHIGEFEAAYYQIMFLLDDGQSAMRVPTPRELKFDDVFQDFAEEVMRRATELQARLGSASVRILQGKPLAISDLVERIRLSADGDGKFDHTLRQIFEATTGVNCTDFFQDQRADSLAINALLDEFEEKGNPEAYVSGRRYFFGHQVPD